MSKEKQQLLHWNHNIKDLASCLSSLSVSDKSGHKINPDRAFALWRDQSTAIRDERKTIYLIGNGASASMASHVAADLAKNALIHTEVFYDLSLMTAIANDLCYERIFAEPLLNRMDQGDMLVAISSSGQSPNVLCAVREVLNLGGFVVTVSAMDYDNALRSLGILNFHVPASTYGMAETCHAALLHYWIDQVVSTVQYLDYEQSPELKESPAPLSHYLAPFRPQS
jgi:D-sedoheptulose 7-phosphate isomerase